MTDTNQEQLSIDSIETAEFAEILILCDQYGIDYDDDDEYTEDYLKAKLKELITKKKQSSKEQDEDNAVEEIACNVRKHKDWAKQLFSKMIKDVNSDMFNDEVLMVKRLEKSFKDFKTQIQRHFTDLDEREFTIVVTGETSAGKSSVMNLILGDDLLPVSALQCTGVFCRLRYSEQKKVVVIPRRGNSLQFDCTSKHEFKETVKKYTRVLPGEENDTIDFVDLYWPITVKLENVVFVDTPGISDNDTLAQRLYDYLPNAMAFIYILNSTNDGGVQQDRIVKILEWQKDHSCNDDTFDPKSTLFICNKWDQVHDEEKNEVEKYIKRKLASSWPKLNEAPVIQISVTDITMGPQSNEGYAKYTCLLSRIYNLIRVGFRNEFMVHLRWITRFTDTVLHIIETQECFFPKNTSERCEFRVRFLGQLGRLVYNFERMRSRIDTEKERTVVTLARSLLGYIHSEIVLRRLSTWSLDDCPKVQTGNPEKVYVELIRSKIQSEINLWYNDGNLASVIDDFGKIYRKYVEELEREFQFMRRGMHTMTEGVRETFSSSYTDSDALNCLNIIHFNWFFGIVSYLRSKIANFLNRRQCNKDRLKYMQECTKKVLSEITEQNVIKIIKEDLKNIDIEIKRAFDKLVEDEKNFLEELEKAPALPGKRKEMGEIKLKYKNFLDEIEQQKQQVEYDFSDLKK